VEGFGHMAVDHYPYQQEGAGNLYAGISGKRSL
jgi:hypothetical protein